jgi:hypothetical protein
MVGAAGSNVSSMGTKKPANRGWQTDKGMVRAFKG